MFDGVKWRVLWKYDGANVLDSSANKGLFYMPVSSGLFRLLTVCVSKRIISGWRLMQRIYLQSFY